MLRKPTQFKRRTVTQTGRIILYPEPDVPDNAVRHVEVTLPESPSCALVLGPQIPEDGDLRGVDDSGARPEDVAFGRPFQWPEPDAGKTYKFNIRADQWIAAMSVEGIAKVTVTVEYCTEPR